MNAGTSLWNAEEKRRLLRFSFRAHRRYSEKRYSEEVSKVFLTAEWRDLVMLNYEVEPDLLRRFVPTGTELDLWQYHCFISLVGFRFLKTKVCAIRIPFHNNFDEVNLRFYVRREERDETKRGVVFIREIVPRRAIARIARTFYNENYTALPMRHRIHRESSSLTAEYSWKLPNGWSRIQVNAVGDPVLPEPGSQEEFITEHYWGYAAQPDGGCVEYQVAHPSWRVWSAQTAAFEGNVEEIYGREFSAILSQEPASAFLAEGSQVTVYRGRRI